MIIGNCSSPFYCLRRGTTIPRKRKKAVLAKNCSGLEGKRKPNHKVINKWEILPHRRQETLMVMNISQQQGIPQN